MKKYIFMAVAILSFVGCKPIPQENGGSSLKTVDNFAAGSKVKEQKCGPKNLSNLAELNKFVNGPDEKLRFAAMQSLASIPDKLFGALFGDKLKGTLHIVDRVELKRQCKMTAQQTKFTNENGSELDFCWTKQSNEPLHLWVNSNEATIRHGVLRLAAYVYVNLIETGSIESSSASNSNASEILKALRTARSELATVFLSEATSSKKYSSSASRLRSARQTNSKEFDNELFVEMVDSVYCSATSQGDFQDEFTKSFDQFVGRGSGSRLNFTAILGKPWHAR